MAWNAESIQDQSGKTAVITGANSGIGFETARVLAAKGANVVLACRNPEKAADALARIRGQHPSARARVMELDLGSQASVHRFATRLAAEHDRLDLLVNNAGVMVPPYALTEDGHELQWGTNHLGHFSLTGLLWPLLSAAPEARVVNVSSVAHYFGAIRFHDLNWERRYVPTAAYAQSKLANLLFTYELQRRIAREGSAIKASASHPGWTATNLQAHSSGIRAFNPVMGMQPLDGALPSLYAATASDVEGGDYYGPRFMLWGAPKRVSSNRRSQDPALAAQLWEVSEQLTDVRYLSAPQQTRGPQPVTASA